MARIPRVALTKELKRLVADAKKAASMAKGLGSLEEWLKKALAISGACEHKEWILEQFDRSVDALLAIPVLPPALSLLEAILDRRAAKLAKAWARKFVANVCA